MWHQKRLCGGLNDCWVGSLQCCGRTISTPFHKFFWCITKINILAIVTNLVPFDRSHWDLQNGTKFVTILWEKTTYSRAAEHLRLNKPIWDQNRRSWGPIWLGDIFEISISSKKDDGCAYRHLVGLSISALQNVFKDNAC